jgi:lipopolysaccharide biosynthesis protein
MPFDLHVTLVSGVSDSLKETILEAYPTSKVYVLPNSGKDIGPFMYKIQNTRLMDYQYICKIHSKRSVNYKKTKEGDEWRKFLLCSLLGSFDRIKEITKILQTNPNVGMVGCRDYYYGLIGENRKSYDELCKIFKIPQENRKCRFFAGTMFWVRREVLQWIKGFKLDHHMFDCDPLCNDGSLSHAMERVMGDITRNLGYKLKPVSVLYKRQF